MSQATPPDTLLVDLLRAQEALRLELRHIVQLCEQQGRELQSLKAALTQYTPVTPPHTVLDTSSTSLWALRDPYQDAAGIAAFRRDARRVFHPPANVLRPDAAYIRYRQLQGLASPGRRIAALTTPRCALAELQQISGATVATELRLCHMDGPLELVEHSRDGHSSSHWQAAGLLALPWLLPPCDLLWIPDPYFASVVLKLDGVLEGFAEKVAHGVLFALDTQDWDEDTARRIAHGAGFFEVVRPFAAHLQRYITRLHESQGMYTLLAPAVPTAGGPCFLLASKRPTPAFQLTPAADQDETNHAAN